MKTLYRSIVLAIVYLSAMGGLHSQSDTTKTVDADDLARKLANPTSAVGTINFFPDIINYTGDLPTADQRTSFAIGLQPALPVPDLILGQNLFFRPLIPIQSSGL